MLVRSQWLLLLPLLNITLLSCSDAASWGDFTKDTCMHSGFRKYYARLRDAEGDDECRSTPAVVGPDKVYFDGADYCHSNWILGEKGEFLVRDISCDPVWGEFRDRGCQGNGLRQFSSILWVMTEGELLRPASPRTKLSNVGGNWQDWCEATNATIRGVVFPQPTRCVNTWLGIRGEFDLFDPCCASSPSELTQAQLPLVYGDDECTEDGPPFRRPARITSFSQVIAAFTNGVDPLEILSFLWNNLFRVFTYNTTVTVMDYSVVEFPSPHELRFQSGHAPGELHALVSGLVIPTIPGRQLVDNGGRFPSEMFAIVDLANTRARMLCTQTLTGCCLVFGWDNNNNRLYIGHAQPNDSIPVISNRGNLVNYLRRHGGFSGVTTTEAIYFFGGEAEGGQGGYNDYTANIMGFVTSTHIFILAQIVNRANWQIVARKMLEYSHRRL